MTLEKIANFMCCLVCTDKYNCHTKIGQFGSSTRANTNCHINISGSCFVMVLCDEVDHKLDEGA